MSPIDMEKRIWIKRNMARLLYKRKRQLDGQQGLQDKISHQIATLNRQANECERKLDRLLVADAA